jgi:DNA polymerase-3 subunit alpha
MIARVRNIITKTGRNAGAKMAALTFEDLTGTIEAVVFSEQLQRHRALIRPDRLVFLRGRVDRRREQPSLRVSEVIALEDGPALLAEAVIVKLNSVGLDAEVLERLRDLCKAHTGDEAHPGGRAVYISIQSPGDFVTLVRCSTALCVRPDAAFVADVEALLGENSVDIVARRRRARRSSTTTPVNPKARPPAPAPVDA